MKASARAISVVAAAVLLGLVSTLMIAWLLPLAAVYAHGTRWDIGGWAASPKPRIPDLWWADSNPDWASPRAGHYLVNPHPLLTSINMMRVIFTGPLEEKPYFRQNPPPRWAATISTDMSEGFEQVITYASGWPFRCFRGEHWISWRLDALVPKAPAFVPGLPGVAIAPPAAPAEDPRHLWTFTHHGSLHGAIPRQPIWPALIANVTILSAAWALILVAPGVGRRAMRRRRGHCPRCNYDLRATPAGAPCPECGVLAR